VSQSRDTRWFRKAYLRERRSAGPKAAPLETPSRGRERRRGWRGRPRVMGPRRWESPAGGGGETMKSKLGKPPFVLFFLAFSFFNYHSLTLNHSSGSSSSSAPAGTNEIFSGMDIGWWSSRGLPHKTIAHGRAFLTDPQEWGFSLRRLKRLLGGYSPFPHGPLIRSSQRREVGGGGRSRSWG